MVKDFAQNFFYSKLNLLVKSYEKWFTETNFIEKKNFTVTLAYLDKIAIIIEWIKLLVWNFQDTCKTNFFFINISFFLVERGRFYPTPPPPTLMKNWVRYLIMLMLQSDLSLQQLNFAIVNEVTFHENLSTQEKIETHQFFELIRVSSYTI